MASGLYHPFSRALYERYDDRQIQVTSGEQVGIFTDEGEWISGELRECDPQMCNWVSGPRAANHRVAESAPHR